MSKFTKPVIDRQIPWCAIFGNHDSEIAEDRVEQMRALQNLPYSLAQPGPKDVDGVGNCEFNIRMGACCGVRYRADLTRCHQATLCRRFSDAHLHALLPGFWVLSAQDLALGRRRL
jgi:hypothetical protein